MIEELSILFVAGLFALPAYVIVIKKIFDYANTPQEPKQKTDAPKV